MTLQRTDRTDTSAAPSTTPDTAGPHLPATTGTTALTTGEAEARATRSWRQPLSVAFLPIAIVAFLVIAFAMALWTFLAATT